MRLMDDRYPMNYREEIVTQVMSDVQHGESLCLVGLAGVGKSNLARFLENPAVVRHYLPTSAAERTHFRRIEFSAEIDTDHLYGAMSAALQDVAKRVGVPLPAKGSDEGAYTHLRSLLATFCDEHGQRIVFVIDEFEALLHTQPPLFLQELRTLRDDHRTSRNVVFLLITHRMPELIRRQPLLQQGGKLFEIIGQNIYALPPYSDADAQSMIDALAARREIDPLQLGAELRGMLLHLSGGHSGLLAGLFNEMHPTFKKSLHRLVQSVDRPGPLRLACENVWTHLHEEERDALKLMATGQDVNAVMVEFLCKRGLVRVQSTPLFFSPIFLEYVRNHAMPAATV
ncbi:MAG: ATP-binding protein [Caldilineaceae bacterium]|nr:ATP-binding protein [Caldilineaceae bacterium]